MNKKNHKESLKNPYFLLIIILALWIISGVIIYFSFDQMNERGTFGDMFGAVNALFSGLAFGGIIYTIYLQRTELILQRKELEMTREELTRSASAQENSEKALAQQVKSMELTAKLNALNSLLEYYINLTASHQTNSVAWINALNDTTRIKNEIENLLNSL